MDTKFFFFFHFQDSYASTVVFTNGCVQELLNVFKNNLLIIGFIAFGFGFMEVSGKIF